MHQNRVFNIMVADDESNFREILKDLLTAEKHNVICASDRDEALRKIVDFDIHVILLDKHFQTDDDGLAVLRQVKAIKPEIEVIMLTAYPDSDSNLEAMKCGASGYLLKTEDYDKLLATINHLLEVTTLRRDNVLLMAELQTRNIQLEAIQNTMRRWNDQLFAKVDEYEKNLARDEDRPSPPEANAQLFTKALFHEMGTHLSATNLVLARMNREDSAEKMADLVNQLSGLTEDVGNVLNTYIDLLFNQPIKSDFEMARVLDKVMLVAGNLTMATGVRVKSSIAPGLPMFHGHQKLLVDAVLNILKNAIEVCQEKKVGREL